MPDKRSHRGAHPDDGELFADDVVPTLRRAVADLSWLLTRGYADPSALKLVGDRYQLKKRQRTAVMRAACSDEARLRRDYLNASVETVRGCRLLIDGYNLLTTIEAALAGGVILLCRDGVCRDIASMHGTWRRVNETQRAIDIIGLAVQELHVSGCTWFLDKPVSNSGRLKAMLLETSQREGPHDKEHDEQESGRKGGWDWQVELVPDADAALNERQREAAGEAAGEAGWPNSVIVSADSVVIDRSKGWLNLARMIVEAAVPDAWVVDL